MTRKLLEVNFPQLVVKFKELEIWDLRLPFFMYEWHYLWFIHSLKFELALRVFDVILFDGFTALFSVANAIFYYLEGAILAEKDGNALQQKLKTPLQMLEVEPTTNKFMAYLYQHRVDGRELLSFFT